MARSQRRRRVACRLKCEILGTGRRRIRGRVVSLSEGGLAVVAELNLEQGDPIRMIIDPGAGARPIKVSAIVWNDDLASPSGRSTKIRKLGCVVSQPSKAFLGLLNRLDERPGPAPHQPIPIARPKPIDIDRPEPDLPRSRELQPPPKREPEETLPYFRVRLKQIGGPRTRILTVRARSATQAEQLAFLELDRITTDSQGWGLLHISRVEKT